MKTIWKFPLAIQSLQAVAMPQGAELLTVQAQGGTPCLWAKVDTEAPKALRGILITGTGHPLEDDRETCQYVSTFQTNNGSLVWHVFDLGEQ